MKTTLCTVFGLWAMGSAFAQSNVGQLRRLDSDREAGELRYRCEIAKPSGVAKIDITLDTVTNILEVELDNNVRIRGAASETLDRKTGTTTYFIQGGSAPYLQRLRLAIRDGGTWARFTKTYGADELICK